MTIKLLEKLRRRKKVKVEFCQNNLDRFLDEASFQEFEAFFQGDRMVMREYKCLSECELCEAVPYAKVDGEVVQADSALTLLSTIRSRVE